MTHPHLNGVFHTGIVVSDLEAGMATYGEALGYHWSPPKQSIAPVRTRQGLMERETWVTFSLEGPHHIELLEHVDPTPFASVPGCPHLHHIGAWVSDLAAEISRLESLGFTCELRSGTTGGTAGYLHNPGGGLLVELVSDSSRPEIESRWQTEEGAPQPTLQILELFASRHNRRKILEE